MLCGVSVRTSLILKLANFTFVFVSVLQVICKIPFSGVNINFILTAPDPLPSPSLSLCCVFLVRSFHPSEEEEEEEDEGCLKLASVPKSVGTPGGQIGGVVLQ